MAQHMLRSRLVAVGQADTGTSPPPYTTRAAEMDRREVAVGTGGSSSRGSSSSSSSSSSSRATAAAAGQQQHQQQSRVDSNRPVGSATYHTNGMGCEFDARRFQLFSFRACELETAV